MKCRVSFSCIKISVLTNVLQFAVNFSPIFVARQFYFPHTSYILNHPVYILINVIFWFVVAVPSSVCCGSTIFSVGFLFLY
jgi:hypothetical protein